MNWIVVFIGGGLGSILRYAISLLFKRQENITLPFATFFSNLISCVIFAILFYLYSHKSPMPITKLLILTGFCGGLSTFSTFSYETFELLKRGDMLYALLNVFFNVFVCLVFFYLIAGKTDLKINP